MDELLQRHQASQGPESKAVLAVMEAIRDVISGQGMAITPVSLFAAATASLTTARTQADVQVLPHPPAAAPDLIAQLPHVCSAMSAYAQLLSNMSNNILPLIADGHRFMLLHGNHLGAAACQVPAFPVRVAYSTAMRCHRTTYRRGEPCLDLIYVSRPRGPQCITRDCAADKTSRPSDVCGPAKHVYVLDVQASAVKPAIACLSAVLAAMDPSDWPSAKAPFEVLVSFCLNSRPKVRKKAHDGVLHVLASIRDTAALAPASAVLLAGESLLLTQLPRCPLANNWLSCAWRFMSAALTLTCHHATLRYFVHPGVTFKHSRG